MSHSKTALALLGVLLVIAGVVAPLPAHADDETTVTGTVRTMFLDPVRGDPSAPAPAETQRQVLTVGDEIYDLDGNAGPSDRQVRVTGSVDDDTFKARRVSASRQAPRLAPTGTTRVLIMLAYWTAPDGLTKSNAASIFTDTNGWYRDASYGALGQTGTVTDWLRITGPTPGECYEDSDDLMARAKSAAAANYTLANYDNFILYFPECAGDADGLAGWGFVGAPNIWINGYYDQATVIHEEGHNYGLDHTHARLCTGGGLSGTCSFEEYGDPYDTMGDYYCETNGNCRDLAGHFSASQKSQLGWLGGRTVDLTEGGTTTLLPMAADADGPHAAVVSLPSGRKYWLEYRQPIDYDSALPTTGTDGLLVHVTGPGTGVDPADDDFGPSLLDVRPAGGISVNSATLRSGTSWVSPEGYTFRVGAVTAAGAALTVSDDVPPPTVVARVPAPDATAQNTLPVLSATFEAPVTGVSNTTFTLKEGTQLVPATVTYAAATKIATLKPTAALKADTQYTLSLTAGIKNAAGVALSPQSWSFLTGPRPAVIRSVPAIGATGIALGTPTALPRITATFSEPVTNLPTTAQATANYALFQGATAVASTVVYDPAARVATLTPDAPLLADKTYTLRVSGAITDVAGNALLARSWTFITGPKPVVLTTAPKINATQVSRTGNLAARFNESVTGLPAKPAASPHVALKKTSSGSKVTVAVSYNASTKIVTINPSSTLASKTKYTVTLGSGIKDVAGNALTTFSWSFTTA